MLLQAAKINIPSLNAFNDSILPKVYSELQEAIALKLRLANTICLILDIWSSSQMIDFIGVAVNMTDKNFNRECCVIGLDRMEGSHNAENIKLAVEKIINQYEFDKKKIKGIFFFLN
jgi:hypothetical protein